MSQASDNRFASGRLAPLEAYRGIAALVVLMHHLCDGFSPLTNSIDLPPGDPSTLAGQPYFFLLNGTAAVRFFFVLSGFVLCWSYFNREDPQKLLLAFLKRWPRLVLLVAVSTTATALLLRVGWHPFFEAGNLLKSSWLVRLGTNNGETGGWTPDFVPSLPGALLQGITTFFTGQNFYNGNIWTMKPEFYGSLITFILACFISVVLGYRYLFVSFLIFGMAALQSDPLMFPFVAGVFLSAGLSKNRREIPYWVSLMLVAVGLYLLGFVHADKSYSWLRRIPGASGRNSTLLVHSFASLCIIFATMRNGRLFQALNTKIFSGLGKISFPLYLVHTPVIFFGSSYLYLVLFRQGVAREPTLVLVCLTTVLVSVGLSIPLSGLDDWWVSRVNSTARKLVTSPSPPVSATKS